MSPGTHRSPAKSVPLALHQSHPARPGAASPRRGGRDDPAEGPGSYTPALMLASSPAKGEVPKSEARAPVPYGCETAAGPAGRGGPSASAGAARRPAAGSSAGMCSRDDGRAARRWRPGPRSRHRAGEEHGTARSAAASPRRRGTSPARQEATGSPRAGGRSSWRRPPHAHQEAPRARRRLPLFPGRVTPGCCPTTRPGAPRRKSSSAPTAPWPVPARREAL